MNAPSEPRQAHGADPGEFLALVLAGMRLLRAAWEAQGQQLPPRSNPVPWTELPAYAEVRRILPWMLYRGMLQHLRIPPGSAGDPAAAQPAESVLLGETSYLALTEAGVLLVENFLHELFGNAAQFEAARDGLRLGELVPRYDTRERTLLWGVHLLKRFRQPSRNQELVLRTAEELAWAAWFDDPLSPARGQNPKVRLHDTIKCLNRNQDPYLVHFKGDGTGRRVGWELR